MLPNWLLGKSKSKLQEILGGGGGGGTTYTAGEGIDITDHEISVDPLLMTDIEQTALAIPTKAAKTQISNPNILHNPWFQVNQRGFTTTTTNEYCVDRWSTSIATTGQTTYTLNSDGTLTIDNTLGESHCYLVQKRTAKTISRIAGKKVTLSIMLSDGTIHSGTETYSATESVLYYEDDDIRLQSFAQTSGQFFVLRVKAGKSVTIKALKLELGSISTLAMDTAPDFATELLKCQRYFQRIANTSNNGLITTDSKATSATYARAYFPIAPLRSAPTVSALDVTGLYFGISDDASATSQATAIESPIYRNNTSYVYVGFRTTGLTAGNMYSIYSKNGGQNYIDFDAEL